MIQIVECLQVEPHHFSWFQRCHDLARQTHGKGVFASDYFEQCVGQNGRFLLLAVAREKLLGLATARLLSPDGFAYYAPFGKQAVELFQRYRIGSMEMASVTESERGKGIGQELGRRRMNWLGACGCTALVGICWESGLPHTSGRVFLKLGFKPLSQVKRFYAASSLRLGFICPVCGSPPCHCAATLYVKESVEAGTTR